MIGKVQSELEAANSTIAELKKLIEQSKQAPDLKAVNSHLAAENDALKKRHKETVSFWCP
jgi:hypothetical protein